MKFFYIVNFFYKHDKTQLVAKFLKSLYLGFRTTLNLQNCKDNCELRPEAASRSCLL